MEHQRSYRESSLIHLAEMWLTMLTPDTHTNMDGFHLLQNRTQERGRRSEGGLTVFVNDRWYNSGHLSIRDVPQ